MINDIFNDFLDFFQSNLRETDELSFVGDAIRIQPMRGAPGYDRIIRLCTAEALLEVIPSLAELRTTLHSSAVIEIYYYGEAKAHIFEMTDRFSTNMIVWPLYWAWYSNRTLLHLDDALGHYMRTEMARQLKKELHDLPTGNGNAFEVLVRRILYFAIVTVYKSLSPNVPAANGRKLRDMLIFLDPSSQFSQYVGREGLPSNTLLLEAKNCKTNKGEFIDQVEGYIGGGKPSAVGLLVTRRPLSKKLRAAAADVRKFALGTKTVLHMHDFMLQKMLDNAAAGDFFLNDEMLIRLFERAKADVG